jgi:hypothetical protein
MFVDVRLKIRCVCVGLADCGLVGLGIELVWFVVCSTVKLVGY